MDEILSLVRAGWALLSGYSTLEQLGIVAGAAAAVAVVASSTFRTASRAAGIGWRAAAWAAARVRGGGLPVRELVSGLVDSLRNPTAWEKCPGYVGAVRHVLNADVAVSADFVRLGGDDVAPQLNRRERRLVWAALAALQAKLDADAAAAKLRSAAAAVKELKV